jgi:ankyrin repeat protein
MLCLSVLTSPSQCYLFYSPVLQSLRTPIFYAAAKEDVEIVQLLLQHGAVVSLCDEVSEGKTKIINACSTVHS